MNRREFLKYAACGTAGTLAVGTMYGAVEACYPQVVRERIDVPGLPAAFRGLRAAFLTDLHHGPWTSLAYIRAAVRQANELKPDLILLGGDYCHNGSNFIEPCIAALAGLRAPMGVFAVLGNHDHYNGAQLTRNALAQNGIHDFDNSGIWLKRGNDRLWLSGVDDYSMGTPLLEPALEGMKPGESGILISHNPDFAEQVDDPRVALILSGHTHGGQVVFPLIGAPIVPSGYGQKYLRGLVVTEKNRVFVSRGLGTITPPVRFCCRPEINLLEFV
jgi:predicted MPP superfamily phosphohydrolase